MFSRSTRSRASGGDDAVGVLLDTFADGRRAYAFATNALGTQWDAREADNGRTEGVAWDAAWTCASRLVQLAYQRGTSEAGEASSQDDTVFTKLSWVF